jgi:hypothetical protein
VLVTDSSWQELVLDSWDEGPNKVQKHRYLIYDSICIGGERVGHLPCVLC